MSIEKQNLKLIEQELYFYHDNKIELDFIETDIADLSAPLDGTGGGSGISKPTERKAIKLLSSKEIVEIRRRINAIEYMIGILQNCSDSNKFRLIELKYFERKYDKDVYIWESLNISRETFYRWKRQALELVAGKLGYRI